MENRHLFFFIFTMSDGFSFFHLFISTSRQRLSSTDLRSLRLHCLTARLFPPLCVHGCLYISVPYLSFFSSISFSLSLSLVLRQPVCLFHSSTLYSAFVLFLCFPFYLYDSPPGSPNRSILVLYFLSLKPWRWIIEQTDLWLHSCCSGVCLCLFSVSISVSLSSSRLLCLFVVRNNSNLSLRVFTVLYSSAELWEMCRRGSNRSCLLCGCQISIRCDMCVCARWRKRWLLLDAFDKNSKPFSVPSSAKLNLFVTACHQIKHKAALKASSDVTHFV